MVLSSAARRARGFLAQSALRAGRLAPLLFWRLVRSPLCPCGLPTVGRFPRRQPFLRSALQLLSLGPQERRPVGNRSARDVYRPPRRQPASPTANAATAATAKKRRRGR